MRNVILGKNCQIAKTAILGHPTRDKKYQTLKIGDRAIIRDYTVIYKGSEIGCDFQTGHHVMIREGNKIGNNVSVGTHTVLEPGNQIGNNVRIHSQCFLEKVTLGDNVFIGPGTVFTDDPHPPCPKWQECVSGAIVEKNVSIGANCTILPGVKIGQNSLIGAGSVVVKDVPANSVVVGNPARKIKNINELKCQKEFFKRPYEWRK